MDSVKYIGMDVHKEAISIAVLNSSGKLVMECTIETKAITILDFLKGLRGSLHVTFEEGTWAAWLYDLMKPHVTELVVCNPRRNALLKKAARVTGSMRGSWPSCCARTWSALSITARVEYGTLKELARTYLTVNKDLMRVMTRVKAIYRSWVFPARGSKSMRHAIAPNGWLRSNETGVRRRAEFYYQQFDSLRELRQEVRREFLAEAQRHTGWKLLRQIPFIGPIRAAFADRSNSDTAPVSHQAAAMDIQRVRHRGHTAARSSASSRES